MSPLSAPWTADLAPLRQVVARASDSLSVAAFALWLAACSVSVSSVLSDEREVDVEHLRELTAIWHNLNERSKSLQTAVRSKVDTLSELLSFEQTIEEKKRQFKKETSEVFLSAARSLKSIRSECDEKRLSVSENLFARETELLVEVSESGAIRRLSLPD